MVSGCYSRHWRCSSEQTQSRSLCPQSLPLSQGGFQTGSITFSVTPIPSEAPEAEILTCKVAANAGSLWQAFVLVN